MVSTTEMSRARDIAIGLAFNEIELYYQLDCIEALICVFNHRFPRSRNVLGRREATICNCDSVGIIFRAWLQPLWQSLGGNGCSGVALQCAPIELADVPEDCSSPV